MIKIINVNFYPVVSSCHQKILQICAWNSILQKAPENTPQQSIVTSS